MLSKYKNAKKKLIAAALALASACAIGAVIYAQAGNGSKSGIESSKPLDIAALTKIAQIWFAGTPVESVKPSRYPGLYEIKTRESYFYTNASADWILTGDLIDVATKENLTQIQIIAAQTFEFSEIPLENTIKLVRGNGSRKMIVFSDPNCGYCKKLESEFDSVKDVTIYIQPWAMLTPDSETKIKAVLCSFNPSDAWHSLMTKGIVPKNSGSCPGATEKIRAVQQMAMKMKVQSSPTLYFESNTRMSAALEASAIEAKLAGK